MATLVTSCDNLQTAWMLPCALEGFVESLGHLVNSSSSLVGRQQVRFVQHHHHARAGELSNQQTLCRLRLHPFHHVHDQHHQVDDLSSCRRDASKDQLNHFEQTSPWWNRLHLYEMV